MLQVTELPARDRLFPRVVSVASMYGVLERKACVDLHRPLPRHITESTPGWLAWRVVQLALIFCIDCILPAGSRETEDGVTGWATLCDIPAGRLKNFPRCYLACGRHDPLWLSMRIAVSPHQPRLISVVVHPSHWIHCGSSIPTLTLQAHATMATD